MRRMIGAVAAVAVLAGMAAFASPAGSVAGFGDVEAGRFYEEPVQWMVDNDITTGTSPSCFSPQDPVTRGQAAAFMWRMEGSPAAPMHDFADVTLGWQNGPVSWMVQEGITTGTSATTYSPEGLLTRGQLAALLHRLAGSPAADGHPFVDVVASWQQAPVSWMVDNGITTGTSATTFSPEGTVTRGQLAAFFYRYKGSPAVTVNPSTPPCPLPADGFFFEFIANVEQVSDPQARVSSDGRYVAWTDGGVWQWSDTQAGGVNTVDGFDDWLFMELLDDGRLVVRELNTGRVVAIDGSTGGSTELHPGDTSRIVDISPNGRYAVIRPGGSSNRFEIVDYVGDNDGSHAVSRSFAQGDAAISDDGLVLLWSLTSDRVTTYDPVSDTTTNTAFTGDERPYLSGDGGVVWESSPDTLTWQRSPSSVREQRIPANPSVETMDFLLVAENSTRVLALDLTPDVVRPGMAVFDYATGELVLAIDPGLTPGFRRDISHDGSTVVMSSSLSRSPQNTTAWGIYVLRILD